MVRQGWVCGGRVTCEWREVGGGGRDNIAITRYKTDDIARSLPTQVTRIMDIYRPSRFYIADIVIRAIQNFL